MFEIPLNCFFDVFHLEPLNRSNRSIPYAAHNDVTTTTNGSTNSSFNAFRISSPIRRRLLSAITYEDSCQFASNLCSRIAHTVLPLSCQRFYVWKSRLVSSC
ncbi:unnamed protein product [Prorocentrum cordatum]|uniref:Uncharacterized protein n=1 Tax=Prorocentrum cordatum TaxID=2364126 RepID=A0ABN9TSH8_9DINO|nr:unnamed protein product [Polarella glacialis]